jgi:hypothetical protein
MKEVMMAKAPKKRVSASSIKIDPNVRCLRIYPIEDNGLSPRGTTRRKTIGIKLSREQTVHLARVLLAASQDWDEIDVTAWRVYKRKLDNTYNVTVTSAVRQ